MNRRALLKIMIAVVLVVSLCVLTLSACGGQNEKNVEKIQIINGSFKENYNLDEQVDYEKIFIMITYVDGTSKQQKVEASWISGFDVTTTGNKTLTVTYKGATANYVYSVNYKTTVTTPVRLAASQNNEDGIKAITLALVGLDKMAVYAVKVEITLNGMTFISKEDAFPSEWAAAINQSAGKLTLLFYSKDGTLPLDPQSGLAKLHLSGDASAIYLEITVSDGIADRKGPDLTLILQ